ncbi:hypothetical protein SOASR032_16240 [Pragia fontium]|uniref:Phage tail fibre repeat n=1 Tax=Pragia fontium TaxID=82985 RepID=A0ABQ5LHK5_9GAMM|nr:phage tail protein [Pragia fontium]GKX63055.1 hypothetical protein SOASR032_16240 [Pragia fontium]
MAFTIEQEQALLALLNEKKITLSELPAATELAVDDLMLIRQGILDKSVNNDVLKAYFTPPESSLIESGIVKLSNAINSDDEYIAATSKAVKSAHNIALNASQSVAEQALSKSANLSDVADKEQVLKNLGLLEWQFGRFLNIQIFNESGIYIPTKGTTKIIVEAIGGGGASGGVGATGVGQLSISGCGTNGAYAKALFDYASTTEITIGVGGAGVLNSQGENGGTTYFGSNLICPGGRGAPMGRVLSPENQFGATATNPHEAPQPTVKDGKMIMTMTPSTTVTCAISLGYGAAMLCYPPFTHMGGNKGAAGNSVYMLQNSSAQAGVSGKPGRVIVWEYA